MHTLVSFLGRSVRPADGYRRVNHVFSDGTSDVSSYFAYSLARRIRPDELVVLGTPGSMWDQLLSDFPDCPTEDAFLLELLEAVDNGEVGIGLLAQLSGVLTRAAGYDVRLRLIPDALDEGGQAALLEVLSEETSLSEEVGLDITHGYRHLPMLTLMAALYLRTIRPDTKISGLWYALLDPATGSASIHDIGGILHFADWIHAVQKCDGSGDLDGVAALVADQEVANLLRQASFLETIHQGQLARKLLIEARERLKATPLGGAVRLFLPALLARTDWVNQSRLYQRQRAHAILALERGDMLRAALYGYEAFITRLVTESGEPGKDVNDHNARKEARERYRDNSRRSVEFPHYKVLDGLRNVLAHGNRATVKEVQRALRSREALEDALRSAFGALLPEALP